MWSGASILVTHPLAAFPGTHDEPGKEATHPCVSSQKSAMQRTVTYLTNKKLYEELRKANFFALCPNYQTKPHLYFNLALLLH